MTTILDDTDVIVTDTTLFELNALRNGVVWDITGATVTLKFKKPDGTVLSVAPIVTDGPNGVAQYNAPTSVLDARGDWIRQWTVTKSGVILSSRQIHFNVFPLLVV